MGEVFIGQGLDGKDPEGNQAPCEAENDSEVDDAAPRVRTEKSHGHYQADNACGEDVGGEFRFSISMKKPH